jgi:NitT/TauT family transport system ATP-binding protein
MRRRKDAAFQALVDRVYAPVAGKTEPEQLGVAPGQPGRQQLLPGARLNALAGLLEQISSEGGRADLYRLAADLGMDPDDVLPIFEAGEILGFLTVQEGDLVLTELGKGYAEASIPTRRELVAGRILRVPVIAWIYETLQRDDDGRVTKEFFLDALRGDFADLAEEQLQNAIRWGRHADLFGFDDDADELVLA